MKEQKLRKRRKILNDPVYGFITIPFNLIFDLIEHPYFQRLRRIQQLGLSHLVYPGAHHNRFHHAIGATHLMTRTLENLRLKGHEISEEEELGVTAAILLHDIGHGPYSHALEHTVVKGVNHEEISLLLMEKLNHLHGGKLDLAIQIFIDEYSKKFLHQLVSSQLDMDRLDYLQRDSFYSGVSEGVIGSDRIIKMLDIANDKLVVEEKGIYSIEKFIVARRLMYWQVYLHKTVVSAEFLLMKVLERAKEISLSGTKLFASPALSYFLQHDVSRDEFYESDEILERYALLDDYDIMGAIKVWQESSDIILATLSSNLVNRRLFKIRIKNEAFDHAEVELLKVKCAKHLNIPIDETRYFVFSEKIANSAYNPEAGDIQILFKDGSVKNIVEASDNLNLSPHAKPVEKYFLCAPKEIIDSL